MTTGEILDMILKKGKMVQDVFFAMYIVLVETSYEVIDSLYVKNSLMEISYNATKTAIEHIYNNQSYFADKIYMSQRSLERARKDIETMSRLEYTDEDNADTLREIESLCRFTYR